MKKISSWISLVVYKGFRTRMNVQIAGRWRNNALPDVGELG